NESLYTVATRFVDVVRKLDPALASASIEGMNAFIRVAIPTGMILAALGYQITEAPSLLTNPEDWGEQFRQAVNRYPEAAPAVDFFLNDYMQWDAKMRASRTGAFLGKLSKFTLDPAARAMYGAGQPGITWQEVVDKGYAVLLDFQHIHDLEARRFAMLW